MKLFFSFRLLVPSTLNAQAIYTDNCCSCCCFTRSVAEVKFSRWDRNRKSANQKFVKESSELGDIAEMYIFLN